MESAYQRRPIETDWHYSDVAPATTNAVVTIPAKANKKHYITTILSSFETANQEGRIEVTCGGTLILESFITGDPIDIEFSIPLECDENKEVELTLYNASNGEATAFIAGYTRAVR